SRLTDYDTLLKNINDLKAGKPAEVPIYDFKSSSRIGFRFSSLLLVHILHTAWSSVIAQLSGHLFFVMRSAFLLLYCSILL
ncbi:hypothetical protein HAX54_053342, partial [Datura stramonium]|nr:hypothetical protein [Datura stramonium]